MKTIREVAREFNVTPRTLRYYEEIGLLSPERTQSKLRTFSKKDITKLKLIMLGKRYGFSLEEIKEMIQLFDCDRTGIRQLERTVEYGEQKIKEIEEKIHELTQLKKELMELHADFSKKLAELKGEMAE